MNSQTQESRTAMLGARVTPRERAAVVFVAGARSTDVSNLLREMSIDEILAERDRLMTQLEQAA